MCNATTFFVNGNNDVFGKSKLCCSKITYKKYKNQNKTKTQESTKTNWNNAGQVDCKQNQFPSDTQYCTLNV